jgi:hypothetical protein
MVHLEDNPLLYQIFGGLCFFFFFHSFFMSYFYLPIFPFYSSVYDTCFDPEGKHILVTGGNHVLVYSAKDGSLIHTLKGKRV